MFTCYPRHKTTQMPRKCKFRLSKLFGKFRRRRGSQGSNPSKGSRPYFIPTAAVATKSKPGDSHGYINPLEWEQPSANSHSVGDGAMATSMMKPSVLTKAASEGSGEHSRSSSIEKERKAPARSVTQPEGTFAYVVDKNDTLTSIAARFETTPSELVKINRLVSRLICPGKMIFVPEKSDNVSKVVAARLPSEERPQNSGSPPSHMIHESPKPGRAERVCDSPSPPHRVVVKLLTKEEEQKLDQDCIERFLKINSVKYITDGRGVVGGVLLVTPNAAMFEPSVMEPLVSERGIDKYYVNALLKNVANAAIYADIAHMKVRNAPHITAHLPPPKIYYPKAHPCYRSQASQGSDADGELLDGIPKRSESQQAVKGSVSDKTDLELSEEEDEANSLGGSCLSDSRGSDAQSLDGKSVTSEVFTEEKTEMEGFANKTDCESIEIAARAVTKPLINGLDNGTDSTAFKSGVAVASTLSNVEYDREVPCFLSGDAEAILESAENVAQPPSQAKRGITDGSTKFEKRDGLKRHESDLPNGKVPSLEDIDEKSEVRNVKKKSPSGMGLIPFLTDSLWSMSQSTSSTKEAALLQNSLNRKHSIPEVQQASEKSRLKMLKRLSYPLWSSEVPEKDGDFIEEPQTGSLDKDASQGASGQNALTRILNTASPRNLVDFSSGLFQRSSDALSKVEEISHFQRQTSYSLPSPGMEGWLIPSKAFFSERRGSSPESIILDTVNPHTGLGRRFSDGADAKTEDKPATVNTKEDIRIEFKSEITLEDKKELFQNIDEIVPVPARSCDDPPLYLCLRMGRSVSTKSSTNSPTACNNKQEKRQKPLKSEYWFSIPKDRVEELFHFIEQWAPGVYGDLNQVNLKQRGLEFISSDELSDDEDEVEVLSTKVVDMSAAVTSKKICDRVLGESHPDWEVVSMKDVHEPAFGEMSLELELPLPELIGETEILTDEHRRAIFKILPARAEGYSWSLIFSASQHGFSLQSLYRTMAKYETPVLLIIQDTENNVFGAMTSCIIKVSDHFYGNGESFLYTFYPEFKAFKWTGENVFFIKGNPESLAIGAGEGLFGLWLDGDLYHGRSHCCKTYNNDTLSNREDFCVKMLEAWGFVEFGIQDSIC